ncbi:MAG: hypothetical protein U0V87_07525 [Acidobacteriota bacterium]
MRRHWIVPCLLLPLTLLALAQSPSWIDLDYGPLLDRRQLTHSGESVGALLRRLAENPSDQTAQQLLDPWLEPYAFVMPDYLDFQANLSATPFHEIGSLYPPGSTTSLGGVAACAALSLESDGRGRVRAFIPALAKGDTKNAWEDAWPVLRHPLAADLARLEARHNRSASALTIDVYAYRHRPERSVFSLDPLPYRVQVMTTAPRGDRPPLDVAALEKFFSGPRTLEGGRLAADGTLTLFGSEGGMSLLGRRISLADLAIAYRAVFHGGLSEPYMSLDRGTAPQHASVNYGGRLRDTSLGLVSLLCDIRFKTFSLGFDPRRGTDMRGEARSKAPSFATHFERFANDPQSAEAPGQQTRLWFYPDSVDLTLSPQADLLALRRVRMSAASERAGGSTDAVASWTKATVDGINADYDKLAAAFPELSDLDTVVRLLSLFTWLKAARDEGLLIPDLDLLLAVELPAEPTPRRYPQQLAFGASAAGSTTAPLIFDRIDIALGLDRLNAVEDRPLPAARRFARAVAALDPNVPDQASLAKELQAVASSKDEATMDDAAFRAERLRMHRLVLGSLGESEKSSVKARVTAGEKLRVLSLGIGGLDLGMNQVLARSQQRALGLGNRGLSIAGTATAVSRTPAPESWKQATLPFAIAPLPDYEESMSATTPMGPRFLYSSDGPGARARLVAASRDGGKVFAIERYDEARALRYVFDAARGSLVGTHLSLAPTLDPTPNVPPPAPPAGLATLELFHPSALNGEAPTVRLRLSAAGDKNLEASVPRAMLQRLMLGRTADLSPARPLGGLAPLPPGLGAVQQLMVWQETWAVLPPWENPHEPLPGEEEPTRVATALNAWWSGDPSTASLRAVVGTDHTASFARFAAGPTVDKSAALLLPIDAFPGATASWREGFVGAWNKTNVIESVVKPSTRLIILVSAESPDALSLRLRHLARDPALKGKALGVLSLMGPLRNDLPASLLREGQLATLGVSTTLPVGIPRWTSEIGAIQRSLTSTAAAPQRPEQLPGSFTWYY